jgi:hypothetical protein
MLKFFVVCILIIDTELHVLNVIKWFHLKYLGYELVLANTLSLKK